MSDKVYDALKVVALVVAPLTVFVSAVLGIWNVPYQAQITATLSAFDVLVGSLVTIANKRYKGDDSE